MSMAEPYVYECYSNGSTVRHCETHTPPVKETDGLLARTTIFIKDIDDGGFFCHIVEHSITPVSSSKLSNYQNSVKFRKLESSSKSHNGSELQKLSVFLCIIFNFTIFKY